MTHFKVTDLIKRVVYVAEFLSEFIRHRHPDINHPRASRVWGIPGTFGRTLDAGHVLLMTYAGSDNDNDTSPIS